MNFRFSILFLVSFFLFSVTLFGQHDKSKIKNLAVNSVLSEKGPTDTLQPVSFTTGTPVLYSFIDGGYCFGNSPLNDKAFAQKYIVPQSYLVHGVALWIGAKQIIDDTDSLSVNFYRLDGPGTDTSGPVNNAPDSAFQSRKFAASLIDTAGLTFLIFPDSFIVYVDYAVGIDISGMDDDTIGLVSTTDGDAMYSQLSWVKWANNTWHTMLEPMNWAMDIDLGIFVIADMNAANVQDNYFIDGLKLSQNQPNPFNDFTLVQYELNDESNNVTLEIFDINGKLIAAYYEGKQIKGKHEVRISSEQLKNGVYYYSLSAGKHRLIKKMVISK
ncbi:MAG: T9SS type A sorting domain-containing protein [Bacteroidota bacterium]